jgi:hypothetical protein
MKMLETIRKTIIEFCLNFATQPYLCYTEHGQHALFYSMLYNKIPEEQRYVTYKSHKICALQKEYPTAGLLGKLKRQHWDIAIIKTPVEEAMGKVIKFKESPSIVEGLNRNLTFCLL